ncbi:MULTISPECIES: hypothetical protein [Actinomadura]|uniref:Uncharacterized protein n=1 Tax=Actinomadura yumaensis TaxID=111807 RepID=A0ABW2CEL3_9ACTN|nr:hypothetical protein [Actinomadura sp. J1-007]MWK38444.1 hypothetical protein [Actinomadura sp. J1-007]
MAGLLSADQAEVIVARHLVGIMDGAADLRGRVALESWLNVGESRVFLRTEEDALHATLHFEVWDDVAAFDEREWQRSEVIELQMSTGRIGADQVDAGFSPCSRFPHRAVIGCGWPYGRSLSRRPRRALRTGSGPSRW